MGRITDLVEELQGPATDLVDAAGRAGLLPRITSTMRSNSEQRRLYNRFLAGQAGYPVAPPGQSAHEYGLAFDMVVSPMEALADVGATWQSWGGGWNPRDAIHFELPGASEWAKTQGGESESIHDWLVREYGRIPWWLSSVMPAAAIMGEATSEKSTYLRSLIAKLGWT
jgi:hypothetical protein